MSCKDQTALITGGCGGLGRAIAEAFLAEGANAVVCDIRQPIIDEFNEKVASAHADRTLAIKCDVTDDSALDDLFAQAEKRFGKVHFVVNCAGMMDKFDPVGDTDRAMWDKVLALNLTAPLMVSKRAVNMMIQTGVKGSIVNIASIAGVRGFMSGTAYTTTKHGLIGLTKNTAAFYGHKYGIRCNAILPGVMETNIFQNLGAEINPAGYEMLLKFYPEDLRLMVQVSDVAKLAVYLASDAGKAMNGACVNADGGAIAH